MRPTYSPENLHHPNRQSPRSRPLISSGAATVAGRPNRRLEVALYDLSTSIQTQDGERLFSPLASPSKFLQNVPSMFSASLVRGSHRSLRSFTVRLAELDLMTCVRSISSSWTAARQRCIASLLVAARRPEGAAAAQLSECANQRVSEWTYFQMASTPQLSALVARRTGCCRRDPPARP